MGVPITQPSNWTAAVSVLCLFLLFHLSYSFSFPFLVISFIHSSLTHSFTNPPTHLPTSYRKTPLSSPSTSPKQVKHPPTHPTTHLLSSSNPPTHPPAHPLQTGGDIIQCKDPRCRGACDQPGKEHFCSPKGGSCVTTPDGKRLSSHSHPPFPLPYSSSSKPLLPPLPSSYDKKKQLTQPPTHPPTFSSIGTDVCTFAWLYGDGSSASGMLMSSKIGIAGLEV